MRHLLFFVLLVRVLFIQCKDFDTLSFNQKNIDKNDSAKIRIPIYSSTKTSQLNPHAPSKSYSKNVYIDRAKKYKFEPVKMGWSWEVFCESHEKKCHRYEGITSWCCPSNQECGKYEGCLIFPFYKRSSSDTEPIVNPITFMIIACCICTCRWGIAQSRRDRFSTQPFPVSTASAINTEQNTNNCPSRSLRTQSLIRLTPRRDLTVSLEQSPPQYDNSNIRRETIISLEEQAPSSPPPPAYNDVIQQSSTTIIMEQQFFLAPPTYDDSIREN